MSRRLVIIILSVLIIGVVGGTIALVVSRLRQPGDAPTQQDPGSLSEAPVGGQNVVDPTADDDGDGLNNADEAIWGTDRNNSDTDGDGFLDGQEVTAGHNPTIPAPNDTLPPGFVPGRELNPLDTSASQVAIDDFFSDNLDLSGGTVDLTAEYKSQFPENERTPDTLATFASQQPIVTQLPTPREETLDIASVDGPILAGSYLQVAGNFDIFTNRERISKAISELFDHNNSSYILGLSHSIRLHQEGLLETQVPPSAAQLHRVLIGYTELLAATFDQIALYPQDPVKATVALYQLEAIDKRYFPIISQEADRLESAFGLSTPIHQ